MTPLASKCKLFQPGTGESPSPQAGQTDGDTVPSAGHLQPPPSALPPVAGLHTTASCPWRSSLQHKTAHTEPVPAPGEEGKPSCSTKPGLGGLEPIKRTAANPCCEGALRTLCPARCTLLSTSTGGWHGLGWDRVNFFSEQLGCFGSVLKTVLITQGFFFLLLLKSTWRAPSPFLLLTLPCQ